ncbi:hypothetical protein Csa_001002 [Cucumis sativus]|uniref:Uncharacterized protein n=1 Tax=Cucumis sativus TaxID=3659 RepID=A0A0A0LCN5_CUCSA|nr:hypothetical protein Csa_001002 [Cucumis sativus]
MRGAVWSFTNGYHSAVALLWFSRLLLTPRCLWSLQSILCLLLTLCYIRSSPVMLIHPILVNLEANPKATYLLN